MRRLLRFAARLTALAAALAAVLPAAGDFFLRQSLPQTTGEIHLAGLAAPVQVMRDRYGIPHIFAASLEDASLALGYVHAQDRLWQMEMSRRIAAGRVAELLGAGALEADRFLRTLGVRRAAEANLRGFDAETRKLLESYAAGVNAFLASGPVLPLEFWLTGARPEPWTPADSVAWTKMMAWDLGGNFRNELLRMSLARTLPLARIHQILPPYPGEQPPVIADLKELYGALERDAVQLARFAPDNEGLGSNNWVVSGARSASGKPLLANDPHLGLTAPPVWYFAHLSVPGANVIGSTLPGVPGVILGRNDRIAWGFTNTGPDVQDLYIEKLDAAGGYLAPEGPRPFQVIDETIRVKGAEPEQLRVRVSRHGPVISDVLRTAQDAAPRGYVIAFAWTALAEDDRSMQAALKFARARDWDGFLAAARDLQSPQQNIVYADVEGNIGFVAAGRVPVRKPANDLKGMAPAPGWLAKYDWDGYIPFEQLPQSFNPASGAVVTANHRITPPGYAHFISSDWQPPYRAGRIQELLDAAPRHTAQSFARIQADVVSPAMREVLPRLLATRPRSEDARKALALLAKWDGAMAPDRSEPLIAWAWWRELTRAIYADELGGAFRQNWLARAPFLSAVLSGNEDHAHWCDDLRTPAVETCEEVLALSLEAALADLARRYGGDQAHWRWGEAHAARHEHRPFGRQPLLAGFFDIRVPSPGDAYTVNVGRNNLNDEAQPFANRHAASLRAIYDLSDLEKSLYIHSGGQSGNILSDHYEAFTEAWARNEYIPMRTERKTLDAEPHQLLRLVPAR
ncbi:MAG: acyl-homoserine-lactone acylase [Acidobacteria bacterium RIFCSPLOWO2_12_FULL_67_14b]|nr:MAG: acyl-homoserine-lactone acylase [Acidobacteria bacterium RIFCSPLOWO2_12_FULL_67_14b]